MVRPVKPASFSCSALSVSRLARCRCRPPSSAIAPPPAATAAGDAMAVAPPDVSRPIIGTMRNGIPWETAAQWIAAWMRQVRDGIGYSTLPPDWDPVKLARAFIYAAGETRVPLLGLLAIGYNESRYNPAAGNSTASGIAGQIPRYAGRFSDANWNGVGVEASDVDSEWTHERLKTSPYESIRIAARHMANLIHRYGEYDEAFRAYARGGANRNDAEGYAAWGRHVRNWERVIAGINRARGRT